MGAIKFLSGGADLMRPGIVEIEEKIKEGDFISVIDINNKKPIIVGIALYSTDDIKEQLSGKSIQNIHYVGDKIWNL